MIGKAAMLVRMDSVEITSSLSDSENISKVGIIGALVNWMSVWVPLMFTFMTFLSSLNSAVPFKRPYSLWSSSLMNKFDPKNYQNLSYLIHSICLY